MTVHPIDGERFRYLVESDRPVADRYLVDLEEYDGSGWCGCKDFLMHHQPHLEAGETPQKEEQYKCKHIIRAHIFHSRERIFGQ